ncbi:Palmitoyl-protein thioesterase [Aspergillus sclerotialis]|uniref:Palmitoyl-protein thioesterase 1 n=1 Tax=Aspergillus sclerotialis TaxID=2070753 RepID=A0A3A2ZDB1_9EURO|nr:Palmitoyl-protein thioesterase [Aspergillus sclerotialis]
MLSLLTTLLTLSTISAALPSSPSTQSSTSFQPPLIIWHGLGDDFERDGLQEVAELAKATNPNTYVHLIRLSDTGSGDLQATFFGNVTEQIAQVCSQLASDPILSSAPSVNALGFSQGGQFLRGYVERCNNPPVRNLVTFGSQHNGISEFQVCGVTDWLCHAGDALLNAGKWSKLAQGHLVPAQYYRNPEDMQNYLQYSNFLADINNERDVKNATYKENLMKLNRLAMFMFEDDQIVHPKETAWFAEVNGTSGKVTPLDERPIYKEDWLGLKTLGELGKLEFLVAPGQHMQLSKRFLEWTFRDYFAPVEGTSFDPEDSEPDTVLVKQPGY